MEIIEIPVDLLVVIFGFCGWKDRILLRRVCKLFKTSLQLFDEYDTASYEPKLCIKYTPSESYIHGFDIAYQTAGFFDIIVVRSTLKFKSLLSLKLNPAIFNCTAELPASIDSVVEAWKKLAILKIDWINYEFDFLPLRKLQNLTDLSVESSYFNGLWRQQVLTLLKELPKFLALTFRMDPMGPT
ncbi:hypothetical protein [Pseudoalteromonas sp.]|uniref:hypothetical protein n=1 Tax=Pseudoalteromonas sp. TaxID=53249 RepID=UPI0026238B0F|nr:hypothetical protein [Pseudoalteromonas sp.]MCP4588249.1 hypothetical protein [Pseudoalteromonas sp.]